jgi:zinc transport system substrate-binding protein
VIWFIVAFLYAVRKQKAETMKHTTVGPGTKRSLVVSVVVAAGIVLHGCSPEPDSGRLKIAVTVTPLAGFIDAIAPEIAEVTVMIPSGANPVTHEPSLSQMRAAASADIYISVGHSAFTWEETWLRGLLGGGTVSVVTAGATCATNPEDPHVWLSLSCARAMAQAMARAVTEARPAEREAVEASLESFLLTVDSLESEADRRLDPHRGGAFVVLHPAWGYLADDHGLEQVSILEHGSGDAGPAELAAIVDRASERGLTDVIVQPQFAADPAVLVASELGGQTITLDPLRRDWAAGFREAIDVLAGQVAR